MLQTTPALLPLLKLFEGVSLQAYFDSVGVPTIYAGLTQYRDGSAVQFGDEISEEDGEEELFFYVRDQVEPILTQHFSGVGLQQNERDALASFIFNIGGNSKKWPTLKRLINDPGASTEDICDQWMKYHYAGKKPHLGLYRRRLCEVLVWLGWDYTEAYNAAWNYGYDGNWRAIADWHSEDIFEELEIPRRGAEPSDPTPDTPVTLDDAQFMGAQAAGYTGSFGEFMAHRTVVRKKNVVSVPQIDMSKPPKPMEDSKTHKGLSKAESGREGVTAGAVLTSGATVLAAVEGGANTAERTLNAADRANDLVFGLSAGDVVTVGLVIGVPLILWGGWRWWAGRMIAYEGRSEAIEPKA